MALTVTLWAGGAGGGPAASQQPTGTPSASRAPNPSAPPAAPVSTPSPGRTYPLSTAPDTIPAIREFTPARGPGWQPGNGRVVVGDDALADEGRLLAGELQLRYAGKVAVGAGDVELALTPGAGGGAESYTMTVKDQRVRITGPGEAGVFYGTRTLKQEVRAQGSAPEGVVNDAPAKPQRGFLIDIARKHYSADWIEDRIRELGDLKYNQLGLHFSDDQAFRIESDSHPEIVSKVHLTKDEVRRIIALAASRHITVVPEIDSPGHLGAVLDAHPDLQLRNAQGTLATGAIDISKKESAQLVDDLLNEYAELFPGPLWHLGGDEYRALMATNPEASYPQLAEAARQEHGPNGRIQDLATDWLNDRADVMRGHGRTVKAWNDGFYAGGVVQPDKDIQVAYWTGKEIGARQPLEYLQEGRDVVNYNDEYLYYVLGQPNQFFYPTGQRIYEQWTPLVLRGTQPVAERYNDQILGAVFSVWSDLANAQTQDQVAQGIRLPLNAMIQKVWDPRQPDMTWAQFRALAEKLG
ncbi:family 20 glycosylhydrolase [Streptomyces sp. PSKA54]|uniref:Family 20 glycosylhydrolase n=1 Tax=Streptomyces himalayensis subsp. aureolus TaxID=2758039 RepID=A0A7W2HF53_9ACTN|nr:family 20 glycosylhydrolase [Streptomyces himalayensis subsp. aureolus]